MTVTGCEPGTGGDGSPLHLGRKWGRGEALAAGLRDPWRPWILLLMLLTAGCSTLPDNGDRVASRAVTDTADTRLGRLIATRAAGHPGESGFILLDDGLDAFVARAALAQIADRSIDLQYYLYHQDLVGALLMYNLLQAADRGVRVRILVDDMDLSERDQALVTIDAHPNIEVRIFNPFRRDVPRLLQFATRFGKVTRRMHNKSFTVDNQATVVGGRNIGDEYFDANPDLAFGDLDVLAVGRVVPGVSASFDDFWNHPLSYPVASFLADSQPLMGLDRLRREAALFWQQQKDSPYVTALRHSTLARSFESGDFTFLWGDAKAVYDSPDKITHGTDRAEYHLTPQLEPYVASMQRELIVLSAYFVPGREGVRFFKDLRQRGVRVRILTNSLASTDVPIVHAGYAGYRRELLEAGVELYEVSSVNPKAKGGSGIGGSSRASLHAKSFVIDRKTVFIGSLNLDPRSDKQNTEIGLVIESPEMGAIMGREFDQGVEKVAYRLRLNDEGAIEWVERRGGKEIVHHTEPRTSWFTRLWVGVASLLPIESQL